MKVQASDVSMQSQHVSFKSTIEQELKFSTYFLSVEDAKPLIGEQSSKVSPSKEFSYNHSYTLNSIIQNLFSMLAQKNRANQDLQEEKVGVSQLSFYEKYEEHESLDFSTCGTIKTDSGCFDIDLNFSMSRSFVVENRIDIYSPFDPLVINLDGNIADLSQDTFSFDLDNDGESDQISKLKSGSGFLALDKNEDGKVNQGSELFGTQSGDGFGELSEYDEDGNNWIDENDSIFNKLQIWLKNDDNSEKELVGLGEVGIGAIYLHSEASQFSYKTELNQTLGEMKSCSFFLNEDGSCGNVAQIDFNLNKETEPLAELLQA